MQSVLFALLPMREKVTRVRQTGRFTRALLSQPSKQKGIRHSKTQQILKESLQCRAMKTIEKKRMKKIPHSSSC